MIYKTVQAKNSWEKNKLPTLKLYLKATIGRKKSELLELAIHAYELKFE